MDLKKILGILGMTESEYATYCACIRTDPEVIEAICSLQHVSDLFSFNTEIGNEENIDHIINYLTGIDIDNIEWLGHKLGTFGKSLKNTSIFFALVMNNNEAEQFFECLDTSYEIGDAICSLDSVVDVKSFVDELRNEDNYSYIKEFLVENYKPSVFLWFNQEVDTR